MKLNVTWFASEALSKFFTTEDYRELLELTLILGENPPQAASFRGPGAFYQVRWMSNILYMYKLILFLKHFRLTKLECCACLAFCTFVS